MRTFALLLMLSLTTAVEASAERYIQLSMHMVKILVAGPDGRINTGTGVQLDAGHVITNCHVVGSAKEVIVARGSGGTAGRAESVDVRHDLCLLGVTQPMAVPVDTASSRAVKIGDEVQAMGFSGGKALSMSSGKVTALHDMDGASVIETDAQFQQGASGGALFDADGHLIGVLTFFIPGMKRHFAVPVDWIARGVAEAASGEQAAQAPAQPFWAAADADKPFFLRAIQHENDHDWGLLQAVTQAWIEAEPGNSAAIEAAVRASRLPAAR
ncbi:MAG: serine protease [Gammaproteobacteria bacterium]|jgi:serine protease Do|nr:serine protease [Gammaproteobacteria bacterium]MBU0771174.1 serine protease [Gammaproteobacteria bacterium]MBU0855902.1 serine protease [Gammaproteobacteria bacterium]MBU1849013.1 serine protease [Gammaproteobacteria bacterium]